ncbi:MAG: hydroxymethylbilane synthase, partial [Dehalococcoidia bacterium]|nr:hydroxymethylbilane synthase [Dehalococcoidia bacterium]
LRGNVDTRLRKAATDEYDAVVLAAAGIKRLGLGDRITQYIPTEICLPAVAQGAMAVEFRAGEGEMESLVALITHMPTQFAILAERAFLKRLEGGCSIPVGAHARIEAADLVIDGVVASVSGRRLVRARESGKPEMAEEIGTRLADKILDMGGRSILAEAK